MFTNVPSDSDKVLVLAGANTVHLQDFWSSCRPNEIETIREEMGAASKETKRKVQ